jgi:hypothetical protein
LFFRILRHILSDARQGTSLRYSDASYDKQRITVSGNDERIGHQ